MLKNINTLTGKDYFRGRITNNLRHKRLLDL